MSEQGRQETPQGKGLRHVALNVTNLEVSKTFLSDLVRDDDRLGTR